MPKKKTSGVITPKGFTRKNDKVLILGTASTLHNTPWNEPGQDIWACAPVITQPVAKGKKFDLLFEMHPTTYWMNKTIMDRLNEPNLPIYMQDEYKEIRNSIKYPLDEIRSKVPDCLARYFTSTIAYMIALAWLEGYKVIELWGVHMSSDEEYGDQRQACESWLAWAMAKGAVVYVPPQSEIFKCPHLYGYEQENSIVLQARIRKEGLNNGLKQIKGELKKLQEEYDRQKGAVLDCEYWEKKYK
jgi:hypothetical protein